MIDPVRYGVNLYSRIREVGRACPSYFDLLAVDGFRYGLASFSKARALVVMFICNHCPYVKAVEERILTLAREYSTGEAAFVAVASNDPSDHPEYFFEGLKARWREKSYPFPYLFDETQSVAKAFDAVCTPDFFVFDAERKLAYRGRLDDNWKDASKAKTQELKAAIDNVLAGRPALERQLPSMGCSIKWIE